jgi:hypothetical protein
VTSLFHEADHAHACGDVIRDVHALRELRKLEDARRIQHQQALILACASLSGILSLRVVEA